MRVVGDRYQESRCCLPELITSGEALQAIGEVFKPRVADEQDQAKNLGKVVFDIVGGDIHDIGKDIVGFMLEVNGFEVYDLRIDQPEENFVKAVQEHKSQVLALSGFLSVVFDTMKSTTKQVEAAGVRQGLKVTIGSGQMDDTVRKYAGADAYGDHAVAAAAFAKETVGMAWTTAEYTRWLIVPAGEGVGYTLRMGTLAHRGEEEDLMALAAKRG